MSPHFPEHAPISNLDARALSYLDRGHVVMLGPGCFAGEANPFGNSNDAVKLLSLSLWATMLGVVFPLHIVFIVTCTVHIL